MRQATAWGVQVGILFMAYFNSFIFCLGFERETFKMVCYHHRIRLDVCVHRAAMRSSRAAHACGTRRRGAAGV